MDNQELYLSENYEVIPRPIECNSLANQMVAMGKALMKAKKKMSMEERKLLIMALTKIKWSKKENPMEVVLSKVEVAEMLGWNYDSSERSRYVRKLASNLMKHSMIQIDGKDKEEWDDGFLVPRFRSTKGDVHIFFAEQFRPLLEDLTKDKDFVTIWANDIYGFNSVYAYLLFEELRLHCDTERTNWRNYSTKELKELFGIPKDGKGSYMHFDKKKGKNVFDRTNFEKKVLDVAIEEINRGHMLQILPFIGMEATAEKPNKLYAKIKKNGFVSDYQFKYVVRTRIEPTEEQKLNMAQSAAYETQLPGQMRLQLDGSIVEEPRIATTGDSEQAVKVLSLSNSTDKEKQELEDMLNSLAADIGAEELKALLSSIGAVKEK